MPKVPAVVADYIFYSAKCMVLVGVRPAGEGFYKDRIFNHPSSSFLSLSLSLSLSPPL